MFSLTEREKADGAVIRTPHPWRGHARGIDGVALVTASAFSRRAPCPRPGSMEKDHISTIVHKIGNERMTLADRTKYFMDKSYEY